MTRCKICDTPRPKQKNIQTAIYWEVWQICYKCFCEIREMIFRHVRVGTFARCEFCFALLPIPVSVFSDAFCNSSHRAKWNRRQKQRNDNIKLWKHYEQIGKEIT